MVLSFEFVPTTTPVITPASVASTGLLCELGLISSLALGTNSTLELNVAFPYCSQQYDALLVCFNSLDIRLPPGSVHVLAVNESASGAPPVPLSPDDMPSVHTLGIAAALSADPFFAQSYQRPRYDDFARVDPRLGSLLRADLGGGAGSNCVLLSGSWFSNRVYTVRLSYPNPPATLAAGPDERIQLWVAPLSAPADMASRDQSWPFVVRGYKYGAVCGSPPQQLLPTSYNATTFDRRNSALVSVRDAAFSASARALREVAGLRSLASQICSTFAREKQALLNGTLSDQLVPGAVWLAFQRDAVALADWQLLWHANRTLWPRAPDGRRLAFPTRERGLDGRCATGWGSCVALPPPPPELSKAGVGGTGFVDSRDDFETGRSAGERKLTDRMLYETFGSYQLLPVDSDRRYRSLYTFAWMGEVLKGSGASVPCVELKHNSGPLGNPIKWKWPQKVSEL
jgi:hypothetical protein